MNDIARCALTACLWEATARKAGNVHRFADFDDLTYLDFVLSAAAVAPVLERDEDKPLGITVLEAIRATREVVQTNTNLGIVLLLTPLSKCTPGDWRSQLSRRLGETTIDDAKHVYQAIRLAVPGGLGQVESQDVVNEPTQTLREVMTLAAGRDSIARQYCNDFREVLDEGVPALMDGWDRFRSVEGAILHLQMHLLSNYPDSLIARKQSSAEAEQVMRRACEIDLSTTLGRRLFVKFDGWLREIGHARNPGTTADLITACLFVALREHRMDISMPFPWDGTAS